MIGWGQYLMVLLLGRLFTLMSAPSYQGSLGGVMLGTVLAVAAEGVLLLPILLIKADGNSIVIRLGRVALGAGLGAVALFTAYRFGVLAREAFFSPPSLILMVLLIIAVCAVGAAMGREALARAGGIVLPLALLMVALVTALALAGYFVGGGSALPKLSHSPAAPFYAITLGEVARGLLGEIFNSGEVLLAIAWAPYVRLQKDGMVKKSLVKGVYGFLGGKLLLLLLAQLLVTMVLGDYARCRDFPFFTLGAYMQVGSAQRLDAVYLLLWTLSGVVYLSAVITGSVSAFRWAGLNLPEKSREKGLEGKG